MAINSSFKSFGEVIDMYEGIKPQEHSQVSSSLKKALRKSQPNLSKHERQEQVNELLFNTLIACYQNQRVIEVSPGKKVVWEFAEQLPFDVFRLPNGNTLITGLKRAIEVTPGKKIIWTKDGLRYGSVRR